MQHFFFFLHAVEDVSHTVFHIDLRQTYYNQQASLTLPRAMRRPTLDLLAHETGQVVTFGGGIWT